MQALMHYKPSSRITYRKLSKGFQSLDPKQDIQKSMKNKAYLYRVHSKKAHICRLILLEKVI